MSFEPELDVSTSSHQPAGQTTGGAAGRRTDLRGMSYAEGRAALSPNHSVDPHAGHNHEPEPAPTPAALPGDTVPADLDTARPVNAAVPQDIVDRIMAEIRLSPRMVAVLSEIEQHGGASFPIVWTAGGSAHNQGEIRLDRRKTVGSLVCSMFHELNHLNDFRQGRRPNLATSTDRAAFVQTKVENEARSQAVAYIGYMEHRDADGRTWLGYSPRGFREFEAHLQTLDGHEAFSSAQIEEAAMVWLREQYRTNSDFTPGTSEDGESYYDYWGNVWDEMHADE